MKNTQPFTFRISKYTLWTNNPRETEGDMATLVVVCVKRNPPILILLYCTHHSQKIDWAVIIISNTLEMHRTLKSNHIRFGIDFRWISGRSPYLPSRLCLISKVAPFAYVIDVCPSSEKHPLIITLLFLVNSKFRQLIYYYVMQWLLFWNEVESVA